MNYQKKIGLRGFGRYYLEYCEGGAIEKIAIALDARLLGAYFCLLRTELWTIC
jgi:hypothetical protein